MAKRKPKNTESVSEPTAPEYVPEAESVVESAPEPEEPEESTPEPAPESESVTEPESEVLASEPAPEPETVDKSEPTPETPAPRGESVDAPAAIMRFLSRNTSGVHASLISHSLGMSLSRANGTLSALVDTGSVRRIGRGVYQVTPRGLEQLRVFDSE